MKDSDWSVEGEYRPNQFALESTDKKGHSDLMRIRVPHGMGARIAAILSDPRLPYRSVSDFFRDGAWHRLYWLTQEYLQDYPNLSKAALVELAHGELIRLQRETDALEALVTECTQTLWKARERRDPYLTRAVLGEIEERIETIREPYRSRLLELAERAEDIR